MVGLATSVLRAAHLYLMRRRQFDNVRLRRYFRGHFEIDVGLYSYGCFDPWRLPGPMQVGRYCSIASTARSVLSNHPIEALTTHPALYERAFGVVEADLIQNSMLAIEDDVWIGHNAIILPGCKVIGRGAIVGAGSVVTGNIERYAIVGGNPAHKLRRRFEPELIEAIEQSRWWELDLDGLRQLVLERPEMVFHPCVTSLRIWTEPRR
jgi:virginiamycin A acetyltransferase